MEKGTEQGAPAAAGKPLTGFGKAARRKRIFARLRDGWAYEEIAREERITARRARQIVSEALRQREVEDDADHALLQLSRLEPALRAASEAVGKGDVKAIAPLMKVLDRLDHYQKAARTETIDRLGQIIEFRAKTEAALEKHGAAREADEAEAEAEDRREAPPPAKALPEEQTARQEADENRSRGRGRSGRPAGGAAAGGGAPGGANGEAGGGRGQGRSRSGRPAGGAAAGASAGIRGWRRRAPDGSGRR